MLTWNNVSIAIPTVAARSGSLGALLGQIAEHCHGAEVVVTSHVEGEPAKVTFPRALAAAAAARGGRPWVLQLEDDVHLAPTFGREALLGIEQADVVTLFSRSAADLQAMDRGVAFRRIGPASFSMSQGFFLRAEFAAQVVDFAPGWYAAHPEHNRAADLLLGAFLSAKKACVLVRIPSLVQHKRGPSTLPGHHGARQSQSYTRAFGPI